MPGTELHLHLDLADAMRIAERAPEKVEVEKRVVPPGYKCIECYAEDGGHTVGCSFRESELPELVVTNAT